jgi:hypothetical protein
MRRRWRRRRVALRSARLWRSRRSLCAAARTVGHLAHQPRASLCHHAHSGPRRPPSAASARRTAVVTTGWVRTLSRRRHAAAAPPAAGMAVAAPLRPCSYPMQQLSHGAQLARGAGVASLRDGRPERSPVAAPAAAPLLHGGAALLGAFRLALRLPCWARITPWAGGDRAGRRWCGARRARCAAARALLPTRCTAAGGAPPLLSPQSTSKLHVCIALMSSAGRSIARACGGRMSIVRRRSRTGDVAAMVPPSSPPPSSVHIAHARPNLAPSTATEEPAP